MYELDIDTIEWERQFFAGGVAPEPEPTQPLPLQATRVMVINEALDELVERIYEPGWEAVQPDGRLVTGAPMGRKGAQAYGLTPTEREVLREHLASKAGLQPRGPLLFFDDSVRAWFADLNSYPTALNARFWLVRHAMEEWQYDRCLATVQERRKG